jgi:hypothetical protein
MYHLRQMNHYGLRYLRHQMSLKKLMNHYGLRYLMNLMRH